MTKYAPRSFPDGRVIRVWRRVGPAGRLSSNRTCLAPSATLARACGRPVKYLEDRIDKVADKNHPGTHLLDLKDYVSNLDKLYPSPDGAKYRYAVARLHGVEVDEGKLWSVMYKYDGTPFPPTAKEFAHWLEGQLNIDTGLDSAFCAQMLANTYQKMGWLKSDHPPNHYNPGSFAKTEQINKGLEGGAVLDKPQYFKP